MNITLNGKEYKSGKESLTVKELLDELSITSERVAVEVNLIIVKKAEYGNYSVHEGDTVEVVNFVGGG